MATPQLLVIPATPLSTSHSNRPASASTHRQDSNIGSFRSSSEDTAVTIFSMYTDAREHFAGSTKVIALNDVNSVAIGASSSTSSQWWPGSPHNSVSKPSSSFSTTSTTNGIRNGKVNGHSTPPSSFQAVVPETADYRHSTAIISSRASEESTSLPYHRNSIPPMEPEDSPPSPPSKPLLHATSRKSLADGKPLPRISSYHSSRGSLVDRDKPSLPPIPSPLLLPIAGPSGSSPNLSLRSHRSEGEDADSFHVRSTYAQLDVDGVPGDGFEEGVELTRAKQGGTEYLTSQAHDRSMEITAQELEILSTVDRYGFFVGPSSANDRMLLLPYSSLLKPLAPVPSIRTSTTSPSPPSLAFVPPVSYSPKEPARIMKWGRMLESQSRNGSGSIVQWHIVPRKERKFRQRVYKGVPDAWRSAAWGLMVERFASVEKGSMEELGRRYRDTLDKPSPFDIQIDLDVPRTISGHIMFRTRYGHGQRSLFHVLHAFSLLCPTCGYVQGMGSITATLLCYFEPEKAYAILVHLHGAYQMHQIFSPGFPGLLESIYVQERVMEKMMPDVYQAFKHHMISSTSYTTKWYIQLFANSVPFQTQLRLWDAYFLEGRDLIVIVAVAVLWTFRNELAAATANLETILSLLSSFFVPESEDVLMKWIERALDDKKLREDMRRWRVEWRELVRTGRDKHALL